jgi:hypothetical protein
VTLRSCRHPGCQLADVKFCRCFGRRVARRPSYVVWATPTHPSRSWAVGHEIRPGCLKVVAYAESKLLADALAKRLAGDRSLPVTNLNRFEPTEVLDRICRDACAVSAGCIEDGSVCQRPAFSFQVRLIQAAVEPGSLAETSLARRAARPP